MPQPNQFHEVAMKIAQEVGGQEAARFVAGLHPEEDYHIRKRTELAARLKHLDPETAYALTAGYPLTDSPAANIRMQQAQERAMSRSSAPLAGAGYGIPAAGAGAVVGHALSEGSPWATAIGGILAGGTAGYMGHRGERKRQEALAEGMVGIQDQYRAELQAAAQKQMEAQRQMAMVQRARMMQHLLAQQQAQSKAVESRERQMPQPKPARPRGAPQRAKQASEVMATSGKRPYNAGDPEKAKYDRATQRDYPAGYDLGIGSSSSDKLAELGLRALVRSIGREMMKLSAISTGNSMGVGGVGQAPSPAKGGGDIGAGARAPRLTAAAGADVGFKDPAAIKPPPGPTGSRPSGTSVGSSVIKAQPAPMANRTPPIPAPRATTGTPLFASGMSR